MTASSFEFPANHEIAKEITALRWESQNQCVDKKMVFYPAAKVGTERLPESWQLNQVCFAAKWFVAAYSQNIWFLQKKEILFQPPRDVGYS